MKITRRTFAAGLGALLASAGATRYFMGPAKQKKNVVLFIADDLRADAVGFMGNSVVKTPNLDKLAQESIVFDNHFVTTSICPVSRASMLTGQYVMQHGVSNFSEPMNPDSWEQSYPQTLKDAGYYTGYVGKFGIPDEGWLIPTFDFWRGYYNLETYYPAGRDGPHLTEIQTTQAKEFLEFAEYMQPFLLVVGYKAPHVPLQPQAKFADLYQGKNIPLPEHYPGNNRGVVPRVIRGTNNSYQYRFVDTPEKYNNFMRTYYKMITGMDEGIGQIVDFIRNRGLLENTSLLFTADNGWLSGEHGTMEKSLMYEESIRVPTIIRPAGSSSTPYNRRSNTTLNIDIAPTILSLAGISIPSTMQGVDMLDNGEGFFAKSYRNGFYFIAPIALERRIGISGQGYRSNDGWKYTIYHNVNGLSEELLFNLQSDPHEVENLSRNSQYVNELNELRAVTKKAHEELSPPEVIIPPPV